MDDKTKAKAEADAAKAAADAKAKAQADAEAAEKAAKAEPAGPICKQEVRYRRRTYVIGEALPATLTEQELARLTELGSI